VHAEKLKEVRTHRLGREARHGHSRQFSRDWAVSGYRGISEGAERDVQASAWFKAPETGLSKSMRAEIRPSAVMKKGRFSDHFRIMHRGKQSFSIFPVGKAASL